MVPEARLQHEGGFDAAHLQPGRSVSLTSSLTYTSSSLPVREGAPHATSDDARLHSRTPTTGDAGGATPAAGAPAGSAAARIQMSLPISVASAQSSSEARGADSIATRGAELLQQGAVEGAADVAAAARGQPRLDARWAAVPSPNQVVSWIDQINPDALASILPTAEWSGSNALQQCVPPGFGTPPRLDEECLVCLESFQEGDRISRLACSHIFHTECITKWMVSRLNANQVGTCPHCNHQVAFPVYAGTEDSTGTYVSQRPVAHELHRVDCLGFTESFHRWLAQRALMLILTVIFGCILVLYGVWSHEKASAADGNASGKNNQNAMGSMSGSRRHVARASLAQNRLIGDRARSMAIRMRSKNGQP
eukprot:Tamp_16179.p1 GENE.Tamp_16179~~Tamp_16179.p1  ORF type:complete len:366 (-),score=40.75 Tamp_16179:223-1320(-)